MTEYIKTSDAPAAVGPYSQGLKLGDLVYTSGQLPINPENGYMSDSVEEQTAQSLKNVEAVLTAAGSDLNHVIKTTVFMADLSQFDEMNNVYEKFFKEDSLPARSCVQVAKLPKDAKVEIEVIANVID